MRKGCISVAKTSRTNGATSRAYQNKDVACGKQLGFFGEVLLEVCSRRVNHGHWKKKSTA